MDLLIQFEFDNNTWLDQRIETGGNFRLWHVGLMGFGVFLSIVVMLCCCFRFRIPRTKQDIEADYQRRIISKKFREKLEKIKNTEMESMDLQRALERIQSEILLDQYDGGGGGETTKDDAQLIMDTVKHKREGFRV